MLRRSAQPFAPRFPGVPPANRTVNPFQPRHVEPSMPISASALLLASRQSELDVSSRKRFDPGASAKLYSTLILSPPSSLAVCLAQVLQLLSVLSCALPPYRHGNWFAAGLWLPGHYSGSPHYSPSTTVSPSALSRCGRLYDLPCSIDFAMGRGRFPVACLPLSPCCPNAPECLIASVSLRRFMLPSPNRWGSASGGSFGAIYGFTCVTAR